MEQQERDPTTVEDFIGGLNRWNLIAGWNVLAQEVPAEPTSSAEAGMWRYDQVRHQLMLAGALVPAEDAERRILVLGNPGLGGRPATTPTIFSDIQLVLPGEVTGTHRHTPTAIRFMIEGTGSYAVTAGERMSQEVGDLVLGPSWGWHSHGNLGADPAIWFDALDIPLLNMLDASFFESYSHQHHPETQPYEDSLTAFGTAGLLPVGHRQRSGGASPLLRYPWVRSRAALIGLADERASPHEDMILEYVHPGSGGPCTPTMGCFLQRLRPGVTTQSHRHTSSAIYVAAEGVGRTTIDGKRFDWTMGDTVVLPSWCWHHHENRSASEEAILFSVTDRPVLESLGLYREEGAT